MKEEIISIDEIHKLIDQLFKKYKYPVVTHKLPMEKLHSWAKKWCRFS